MTRARLATLAIWFSMAALLPTGTQAYVCQPVKQWSDCGWLIKWFPGSYAYEQDRVVRVYSAIPGVITTSALQTRSQNAWQLWYQASGFCTPSFTYSTLTSPPASTTVTCLVIFPTTSQYVAAGGDANGEASTRIGFNCVNGNMRFCRILVDGSKAWSPSCAAGGCPSGQFSLYGTLVHEWGHALSLGHPVAPASACLNLTVMEANGNTPGSSWQERLYDPDAYMISLLYTGFPVSAGLQFSANGSATTDTLFWSETVSRSCWYNLSVSDACLGPYTSIGRVLGVTATNKYSFITPAEYNRNYYYRLTVEQEGVIVDSARTTSERTMGTPVTVPGTPTSLVANGAGVGGVALGWNASSGPVDGYYVYRSILSLPDCIDGDRVLSLTTTPSLIDATAEAGVTYAYRVRAFNSTASSPVCAQVTAERDITPPSAVSDLSLNGHCTSVDVAWTAPGDDGTTGTAHHYDLRMYTSNITSANFAAATPVSTGPPGIAGSQESVNVYLGACSGTHYFALKTVDEWGNTSALGNVAHGGTPCIEYCDDGFALPPVSRLTFALAAPAPNPASGTALLNFSIPSRLAHADLELCVFDPLGRPVRTIQSTQGVRAGSHSAIWDLLDARGKAVPNGVYFLRLQVGGETARRMLLVLR